jgi:pimeloyl-ACP methyl ester carboxylesterase
MNRDGAPQRTEGLQRTSIRRITMTASALTSRLNRRATVRLGAGGAAAALAVRGRGQSAAQDGPAATFVLVHGAWAGAWIWRDIIPLLRAAGHEVYASTATGMGDRVHLAAPEIDLATFVTDVVNLLEYEDLHDVTLVGWSYGGMTITGVAERVPERLAQVVYLDAAVPADGENAYDVLGAPPEARAADAAAAEAAGTPGFVLPIADMVRAQAKDPAAAEWLLAKLVPQPVASFTQPIRLGEAAALPPRVYLYATEGKEEPFWGFTVRAAERARAEPGWRVRDLADNHFAPINSPQATVEALLSLV